MEEITYDKLLDCYNILLEYAGRQYLHLRDAEEKAEVLRCARDDDEITPPADIDAAIKDAEWAAELVQRKLDAAQEIIADFYFDDCADDAQDAIQAMAAYLDYQDKAAEALAAMAPPEKNPREVIAW